MTEAEVLAALRLAFPNRWLWRILETKPGYLFTDVGVAGTVLDVGVQGTMLSEIYALFPTTHISVELDRFIQNDDPATTAWTLELFVGSAQQVITFEAPTCGEVLAKGLLGALQFKKDMAE